MNAAFTSIHHRTVINPPPITSMTATGITGTATAAVFVFISLFIGLLITGLILCDERIFAAD
jgi:hypothetical protein